MRSAAVRAFTRIFGVCSECLLATFPSTSHFVCAAGCSKLSSPYSVSRGLNGGRQGAKRLSPPPAGLSRKRLKSPCSCRSHTCSHSRHRNLGLSLAGFFMPSIHRHWTHYLGKASSDQKAHAGPSDPFGPCSSIWRDFSAALGTQLVLGPVYPGFLLPTPGLEQHCLCRKLPLSAGTCQQCSFPFTAKAVLLHEICLVEDRLWQVPFALNLYCTVPQLDCNLPFPEAAQRRSRDCLQILTLLS